MVVLLVYSLRLWQPSSRGGERERGFRQLQIKSETKVASLGKLSSRNILPFSTFSDPDPHLNPKNIPLPTQYF